MSPLIDSAHRGPIINLAAWITLVPLVFFTLAKVSTKWKMTKVLQLDDVYMTVGMVIAIAQIINTVVQVNSGLGQHRKELTEKQFQAYQKTTYISEIFYIVVIASAKLASLQFLMTLTRAKHAQRFMKGILTFLVLWLMISIFCVSFQCAVPRTWDSGSGKCFNQLAFWTFHAVVDIVTQIVISLSPIYLLHNLQMPASKKRVAMGSFTPNLTTIPLTIFRLIYLFDSLHSSDASYSGFKTALVSEIHINYSIIASSIPFMRPLIESLAVGLMTNDIRVPVVENPNSSSQKEDKLNPFALLSGRSFVKRSLFASSSGGTTRARYTNTTDGGNFISTITAGKKGDFLELESRENRESYGSEERMVINEVRTTIVTSDLVADSTLS